MELCPIKQAVINLIDSQLYLYPYKERFREWELPNIFKTVRLINQARIFKLVFLGLFSQAVITNFCCLFGHNYQFKA